MGLTDIVFGVFQGIIWEDEQEILTLDIILFTLPLAPSTKIWISI